MRVSAIPLDCDRNYKLHFLSPRGLQDCVQKTGRLPPPPGWRTRPPRSPCSNPAGTTGWRGPGFPLLTPPGTGTHLAAAASPPRSPPGRPHPPRRGRASSFPSLASPWVCAAWRWPRRRRLAGEGEAERARFLKMLTRW